jgi:hypothetical protein
VLGSMIEVPWARARPARAIVAHGKPGTHPMPNASLREMTGGLSASRTLGRKYHDHSRDDAGAVERLRGSSGPSLLVRFPT